MYNNNYYYYKVYYYIYENSSSFSGWEDIVSCAKLCILLTLVVYFFKFSGSRGRKLGCTKTNANSSAELGKFFFYLTDNPLNRAGWLAAK